MSLSQRSPSSSAAVHQLPLPPNFIFHYILKTESDVHRRSVWSFLLYWYTFKFFWISDVTASNEDVSAWWERLSHLLAHTLDPGSSGCLTGFNGSSSHEKEPHVYNRLNCLIWKLLHQQLRTNMFCQYFQSDNETLFFIDYYLYSFFNKTCKRNKENRAI